MEWHLYLQAFAALLFVIGLIGLSALSARWIGTKYNLLSKKSGKRRLAVKETLVIDGKRRLLLIKRDHVEHLILIHPGGDTVIEQNILPEMLQLGKMDVYKDAQDLSAERKYPSVLQEERF